MNQGQLAAVSPVKNELLLIAVLAAIQFSHVLDFMIMMPLGPQIMRALDISPRQFGWLVSVYTLSASLFGILNAFFVDRFDRKKALLVVYAGFALGTLLCGMATTFELLLLARIVAGAFGGSMGGLSFAILGDAIPDSRRGEATGKVMASFSVASVAGVPLGLFIATHFNWKSPFLFLGFLALCFLVLGIVFLPSMKNHLRSQKLKSPWFELKSIIFHAVYLKAFLFTFFLMAAGFIVIPYLSLYLVNNVGVPEDKLPLVYLCGGMCTLFTAPAIGRIADRIGKLKVFVTVSFIAILPILVVTNLVSLPLPIVLFITSFFMVFVSGRIVPAMAIVTGTVEPVHRGSFMSLNSSVQNLGSGTASFIAGSIIYKNSDGRLENYNIVGFISVITLMFCVYLVMQLNKAKIAHHKK